MKTYTAQYDGECGQCLDEVFEGDKYGWVSDQFVCTGCLESFDNREWDVL